MPLIPHLGGLSGPCSQGLGSGHLPIEEVTATDSIKLWRREPRHKRVPASLSLRSRSHRKGGDQAAILTALQVPQHLPLASIKGSHPSCSESSGDSMFLLPEATEGDTPKSLALFPAPSERRGTRSELLHHFSSSGAFMSL